jgi:hypothetical protein
VRRLSEASRVSVGSVHNTFAELRQRGHLKTIRNRLRLIHTDRLIEQ